MGVLNNDQTFNHTAERYACYWKVCPKGRLQFSVWTQIGYWTLMDSDLTCSEIHTVLTTSCLFHMSSKILDFRCWIDENAKGEPFKHITNLEIVHLSILLSANRNIQSIVAIIIVHVRENLYVNVAKEQLWFPLPTLSNHDLLNGFSWMSIPSVISAQTRLKGKHAQLVKRKIVSYASSTVVRDKAEFNSIPLCLQHEEQASFLGNTFPVENMTELMKLFQVVNKCSKHSNYNQNWKNLKFLCSLFSEILLYIVYIKNSATGGWCLGWVFGRSESLNPKFQVNIQEIDLSYREFAEMVVMSDVWCGFLPKEKPYWCNKGIRFGARCLVWHSILHWRFFFHRISGHPILLFKLRRQNTPRDGKRCSKLLRLELLEVTYEILFNNFHGAKEIVWMKEILELWEVEL